MFTACQKWPPFLTSFLRYCKDIVNLLLWVIWECLIMPINNDNNNLVENFDAQIVETNFQETLIFISIQKINYIFNFFSEILQRHCKLAILGPFGMHDIPILSTCSKLSCLSACKKSTSSLNSFYDIAKSKHVILDNLGMSGHTYLKW